jgi:transcriptional regulator with XRE-family HTH domain
MPEKKTWKNCNRFSEKLSQKMLQLGLNGQKLARKSDVSDSEISRIINGRSLPGLENAVALARSLDVSLDYLADDTLDADPKQPKESADERETTIQRLAREIGYKQAEYILENAKMLGYEVAMHRLIEAKPVVAPLIDATRPVAAAPMTATGRASSA